MSTATLEAVVDAAPAAVEDTAPVECVELALLVTTVTAAPALRMS